MENAHQLQSHFNFLYVGCYLDSNCCFLKEKLNAMKWQAFQSAMEKGKMQGYKKPFERKIKPRRGPKWEGHLKKLNQPDEETLLPQLLKKSIVTTFQYRLSMKKRVEKCLQRCLFRTRKQNLDSKHIKRGFKIKLNIQIKQSSIFHDFHLRSQTFPVKERYCNNYFNSLSHTLINTLMLSCFAPWGKSSAKKRANPLFWKNASKT